MVLRSSDSPLSAKQSLCGAKLMWSGHSCPLLLTLLLLLIFLLPLFLALIRPLLRQRLPGRRIVPSARLDLVILLALDFQLPVAAVQFGVEGRVAEVVLAAQLGGDLVEGLTQFVELVADVDN